MKVIIFKNEDGGVGVMYPVQHYVDLYGIDAVARKDVKAGTPFKIIDTEQLPMDIDQARWDVDEADLTDGVGSESNEFN
jgi:hypothetical protein